MDSSHSDTLTRGYRGVSFLEMLLGHFLLFSKRDWHLEYALGLHHHYITGWDCFRRSSLPPPRGEAHTSQKGVQKCCGPLALKCVLPRGGFKTLYYMYALSVLKNSQTHQMDTCGFLLGVPGNSFLHQRAAQDIKTKLNA